MAGSPSPPTPPSPADPSPASASNTATPATPTAPPHAPDSDAKANETVPDSVQLSDEQKRLVKETAILDALARHTPYREIMAVHHVSPNRLVELATRLKEWKTGGVANLMALSSLEMIEHWREAAINGAKQGKHSPARDWLIHAKTLEPLASDATSGAKVAIIIGMPGQPLTHDSPQAIDVQVVSDDAEP